MKKHITLLCFLFSIKDMMGGLLPLAPLSFLGGAVCAKEILTQNPPKKTRYKSPSKKDCLTLGLLFSPMSIATAIGGRHIDKAINPTLVTLSHTRSSLYVLAGMTAYGIFRYAYENCYGCYETKHFIRAVKNRASL